jgi:hypothetical protein
VNDIMSFYICWMSSFVDNAICVFLELETDFGLVIVIISNQNASTVSIKLKFIRFNSVIYFMPSSILPTWHYSEVLLLKLFLLLQLESVRVMLSLMGQSVRMVWM